MANEYGLDAHYFKKNLDRISRDADQYTPEEMATALTRLSGVARASSRSLACYKSDWINIKDRWPDPQEHPKILAFGEGYIFECEFDDGFWCNLGGDEFTHWIPVLDQPEAGL